MCFPINDSAKQIPDTDLPFCISHSGFKYLGININPSFSELFKANFTPIMEKLKSDLQRWSAIYLSLAGKINCIKMNVLPRFLYLFQSIPVFLPKSFFRSIDALLSSFIWGGKSSRLRKTLLERPRKGGGLALQNFRVYYCAANLQKIIYWFQAPDTGWCNEEAKLCNLSSLPALLTTKLPLSPSRFSSSPVVRSTLRIWIQFRPTFKLCGLSILSPICYNHLFPAADLGVTFMQWDTMGLTKCKDFFIDNIFPTFTDLAKKHFQFFSDIFRSATLFKRTTHRFLNYLRVQTWMSY